MMKATVEVLLLLSALFHSHAATEDFSGSTDILRDEAFARLNELGNISDSKTQLQRSFLSPASLRAMNLIKEWMEDAGLNTWIDQIGNVHGRANGSNPTAPMLIIGSHMDTVVNAGKYDGQLGIVTAIAAMKVLHKEGKLGNFSRPIEVIAFSDEEGIRFQTSILGSGAIAGTLPSDILSVKDKSGFTMESVLKNSSFEGTKESIRDLKYDPKSVWGYIEAHIEQGPILEAQGLPLGIVDVIAGQIVLQIKVQGSQGHAGTVPMAMRRDPIPAAAKSIFSIEKLCKDKLASSVVGTSGSLVCTVGQISALPGASNVIPGEVTFTVDVRSKEDVIWEETVSGIRTITKDICKDRNLTCGIKILHEAKAVNCDQGLMSELRKAAEMTMVDLTSSNSSIVPTITSGAGHDAVPMSQLTKVGMLFVRCKGGISHSPAENVLDIDVMAAGLSILHFLTGGSLDV